MEPMNLGSPGSPSPSGGGGGNSNFLPSFLMGDTNIPSTPRSNTLSPTRGRTQLAFGNSPRNAANTAQSPPSSDFNRSMSLLQQRSLFSSGQPQQHYHQQQQHPHHHHQSNQQLNASISGPPTMGLFDSLKTLDTTSTSGQFGTARGSAQVQQSGGVAAGTSAVNFSFNQSYGVGGGFNESSINEAYLTQSDFNVSRLTSPHQHLQQAGGAATTAQISGSDFLRTPSTTTHAIGYDARLLSPRQATAPFWVTVFGFPPAAVNAILSHFAQCGTIVDKMLPPNGGGNWMHLKYASRVECDKAVNFNERIIGNCMMIGVVYCRDADIVDKENNGGGVGATDLQQQRTGSNSNIPVNRVRPLGQSAFHNSLSPTEVVLSPTMPKRSTGLVNKAMDMLFGW